MQPLASAMTTLRQVLAAAIKSLLRGKSLIRALLSFWIRETPLKGGKVSSKHAPSRTIDDFLREAEQLFVESTTEAALREFSSKLKVQFREGLWSNPACMLPSFNHQLPHGFERGQYLVLDVGGSTLRVALAELRGRGARGAESEIIRMDVFKINPQIKSLKGMDFFDWVAQRISETLSKSPRQPPPQQQQQQQQSTSDKPLPLGIAWSFPIEQTSIRSGRLHDMGKGFLAAEGLLGQDLGDIIESACQTVGLIVEVSAIVNDSTATLLSQAYINPSTRFGLILGTGVNIAAHLPISVIGREKFGARPDSWYERASHVVVNTELGMFGKGILPATRWDRLLNASHPRPDFQPLEQMVSGYYLGEICRYALIEAINSTGLFGGVLPPSLSKPYSLDTETLSIAEEDPSPTLETAVATFKARHPSPVEPTTADLAALRALSSFISRRSAAIVAASLFALWQLKAEVESESLAVLNGDATSGRHAFVAAAAETELKLSRTVVSFNGSVIENYPNYLETCQKFIDTLVAAEGGIAGALDLVAAKESSLLGAAVALACVDGGNEQAA